MSEALPNKKRVNEAKVKLEKAGVKYILSCWIDLLGIPKTKPIPMTGNNKQELLLFLVLTQRTCQKIKSILLLLALHKQLRAPHRKNNNQ